MILQNQNALQNNNNKKITHIKSKSAWAAAKKILTIYLEYEDEPEEVADSGNRKGKHTK